MPETVSSRFGPPGGPWRPSGAGGEPLLLRRRRVPWRGANPAQRDRRNLTPDQLALVMGRHYNRVKLPATEKGKPRPHRLQNEADPAPTRERIAALYGVGDSTIERAGKFAAAVETLKAVRAPGYPGGPDGWRPRGGREPQTGRNGASEPRERHTAP